MKCPLCGHIDNKVVDSRAGKDADVIRRRRECLACRNRFTTYERVEEEFPLVVKRDGRRETFDRQKIFNGIMKACEKRPVGYAAVEKVVDTLQAELQASGEKEIESVHIGERVMAELLKIDDVAYVRFASVYRQFKDANQFVDEIRTLITDSSDRKARH